jgi:hypothetical protein
MNGWIWRPAEEETIYRQALRAKGGREPGSDQASLAGPGPIWPGLAPSRSPMLLGQLLTCSLMHVGP